MNRVVFLLEEASMRDLLDGLLPRLYPNMEFMCLAHEGKSDLEKSIPRKLRAWREPGVGFVILRDNDGGDCVRLKRRLLQSCQQAGRPDTLVRIVCQELEAWYLGEPDALADAFGKREFTQNRWEGALPRSGRSPATLGGSQEACAWLSESHRREDDGRFSYARKKLFEEFSGPAVRA